MYPTVLVMLALDDRDAVAIDGLLELSGRMGVQHVVLLHVVRQDPVPGAFLPEAASAGPTEVPEELAQHAATVRAALPDASVETRVECGNPVEVLIAVQEEVGQDLLVIGRTATDNREGGWGPSGRNLVRNAESCVLVVPRSWRGGPMDRAVTGFDFSGHAAFAVERAVQLFEDVECIYQFDPSQFHARGKTASERLDLVRTNALRHFREFVQPELPSDRVPDVDVVAADRASSVLLDRAGRDRVVVLGSRGMSPLASMVLGSTAETVCGESPVPVLVVRKKGEPTGFLASLVRR